MAECITSRIFSKRPQSLWHILYLWYAFLAVVTVVCWLHIKSSDTRTRYDSEHGTIHRRDFSEAADTLAGHPERLRTCPWYAGRPVGTIAVNLTEPESVHSIPSVLHSKPPVSIGGRWRPENCTSRSRLAVVISYRNRTRNLKLIIQHLHPFLQKQLIEYQIFIIEPESNLTFNRGILKNIGFEEAIRVGDFSCVVFHDLDLLPEVDRNLYHCPTNPRHLVVAIDTNNYEPFHDDALFGGAVLFRTDHFRQVNGYSNLYFDWGGEDDDLMHRVLYHGYSFTRPRPDQGRYKEAVHERDPKRPRVNKMLYKDRRGRFLVDGLNNLRYKVIETNMASGHTWIYVSYDEKKYKDRIEVFNRSLAQRKFYWAFLNH